MARKIPPPLPPSAIGNANRATGDDQDCDPEQTPPADASNGEDNVVFRRQGAIPRRPQTPRSSYAAFEEENNRRIRRRMDSLHLDSPATILRSPTYDDEVDESAFPLFSYGPRRPPFRETVEEGQELFLHFLHERMRSEGVDDRFVRETERFHNTGVHRADDTDDNHRRSMNLENFQNPIWRQTGRDLKVLAEAFARSHQRELVRLRASSVDFNTLNMQKFICLLKELFQGGNITRERILVLFFFSSDLALRAIHSRLDGLLGNLTLWSVQFIREQVSAWVQANGGWGSVLGSGINIATQVAVIGMCAAVIGCCFIYIRKNL